MVNNWPIVLSIDLVILLILARKLSKTLKSPPLIILKSHVILLIVQKNHIYFYIRPTLQNKFWIHRCFNQTSTS